jgi:hypothetical protein
MRLRPRRTAYHSTCNGQVAKPHPDKAMQAMSPSSVQEALRWGPPELTLERIRPTVPPTLRRQVPSICFSNLYPRFLNSGQLLLPAQHWWCLNRKDVQRFTNSATVASLLNGARTLLLPRLDLCPTRSLSSRDSCPSGCTHSALLRNCSAERERRSFGWTAWFALGCGAT